MNKPSTHQRFEKCFYLSALTLICLLCPCLPGFAKSGPVARDNAYTLNQSDSDYKMEVLTNDTDADGDDLQIVSFTENSGFYGTVTLGSGWLLYTPSSDARGIGTFSLTYTITDGWKTDSATVTITVQSDSGDDDSGGDGGDDTEIPEIAEITGDIANWPIWPQKGATNQINTYEPSPLTPVGRDMTAWVTFAPPTDSQEIWGGTLSVLRSDGQGSVDLLSDGVDRLAHVDYFTPAATSDTPSRYLDDNDLEDDLKDQAVLPLYVDEWFVTKVGTDGTVTQAPNQTFPWTTEWDSFLRSVPKAEGKTFADSGHAWPLVVWKDDRWTSMIDADSAPAGWGEAPRVFLPTNDGLLNVLATGETAYTRSCAVLPGAAFPISVYLEHRNRLEDSTPRMTMLDGPVMVRDVQDDDEVWHRVLVGTTGLGVDLDNKEDNVWIEEGEPVNPDGSPEDLSDGHHFAIYGLDVTEPDYPSQLWTLENIHWDRDGSNKSAELDMEYGLSRPVIGYTSEGTTRTWHALFVGLDADGNLQWLDLNPITGTSISAGSFGTETSLLSTENVYPSRILAAYPKEGGEPVLSDVYIYLSDGSLYFWNLQDGETPKKLASFSIQSTGEGCPPITNFDVAYSDVNDSEGDYHTYFSVVIDRDLPGGNPGDSQSLLVVDLEDLLGDDFRTASATDDWEPVDIKMQGAEGKDATTLLGTNPFEIQLDEGNGNGEGSGENTDLETLAADPVFVDGTLYMAAYRPEYEGKNWKHDMPEVSRLYTLPLSLFASDKKSGNSHSGKTTLVEGTDYVDIENTKATRFFVDSSGTLLLVDDAGSIIHSADVIDMTADEGTGGTVTRDNDMAVLYWRER